MESEEKDNNSNGNGDVKGSSGGTVETAVTETQVKDGTQAAETETSDERQASETGSSLRGEKEETETSVENRDGTVAAGTIDFTSKVDTIPTTVGVTIGEKFSNLKNGHGIQASDTSATVVLNLETGKKARITVGTCIHNDSDKSITDETQKAKLHYSFGSTPTSGDLQRVPPTSGNDDPKYVLENAEGTVTLSFTMAKIYIHSIQVEYTGNSGGSGTDNIDTTHTSWKFNAADFRTDANKTSATAYNGLKISGGQAKAHNDSYLYIGNGGTLKIPVAGDCIVTVKTQYGNEFYFENNTTDVKKASGAAIQTYTYAYTGPKAYVTLTSLATTYFTEASVTAKEADKYAVTVTSSDASKGTASADVSSNISADATVTLTAVPKTGYKLTGWTVTSPTEADKKLTIIPDETNPNKATFKMPASDVAIKAEFGEDENAAEIADEDGFYNGFAAGNAVKERPYYYDFATEYASVGAGKPLDNEINKGLFSFNAGNTSQAVYHSANYGVEFKTNNKLTFKVAGDSYIVVGGDNNNTCADLAASSTSGDLNPATLSTKTNGHAEPKDCKTKGANTLVYEYIGDAGTVDLTLKGSNVKAYIAYVCVIPNTAEAVDENNNFKEWLDKLADENGTVAAKAYEYQGGTVTLIGNGSEQFTKFSKAADVERDGEKHNGYKAGNRHAAANDIPSIPKAGDGCSVIFVPKATGMFKIYFWSTSFVRVWRFDTASGDRDVAKDADGNTIMVEGQVKNPDTGAMEPGKVPKAWYLDSGVAADSFSFKAEPGKTYVMSTTGATNNMAYIGYQFIQDMNINVETAFNNIDAGAGALDTLELTLTDAAFGTKKAAVKKDTAKVWLLKNHAYKITSNDGGVRAEVGGKDTFTADGSKITFDLYNVADETLTGEITGTPEGTVKSLKFVNMVNGSEFTAEITGVTYTCSMKPGEYNTVVETTNGGKTYDRVSVKAGAENVNEVYVEVPDSSKARTYAPADIVELEQTGLALRSDNGGDVTGNSGATVKVPVTGRAAVTIETYYLASYKVNGTEYTNTSKSTASNQQDKMTVEGDFTIEVTGSGTTFFRKISVSPVTEFKSELNVPGDYDTLNKAFAAIASMENRPEGEAGRVTVNLKKDIREQTVLNAPYVTLKGNGHTIDWYYGVGTKYYSVDKTGLYSERLARDKYSSEEGNGNLWGGVFIVRGSHFTAEDTTFKNTYNYELTDEEKTDIAGSTLSVSRLAEGADVTAYAYKERSNAFYIEADNIECYNCRILSSQDTLGRNGSANNGYHVYFKDCVIGGNVDYVCGEFAAVFDNCELQWKTFSDKENDGIGYIVAPKTSPNVFRNCTITIDKKDAQGVLGYYGRTWGQNSNAAFINTETNGYIKADGWTEMSKGEGASAVFKEHGNTSGGAAFATAGSFCPEANQTLEAVQDYIDTDTASIVDTVLGGWKPGHYSYEPDKKAPVRPEPDTETIAKPTADPAPGAVAKGTAVTLKCDTQGADIYYTTDGSAPAAASAKYTAPIAIDKAVTIKAIAVKGAKTSEAAEFAYTVTDEGGDKPGSTDDETKADPEKGLEITGLNENKTYSYTGAAITPDFSVVDLGLKISGKYYELLFDIDYTVQYKDNKKPGKATITVIGKGNYDGKSVTESFTISDAPAYTDEAKLADLKGAKLDKIAPVTYIRAEQKPVLKIKLKGETAFTVYAYDSTAKAYKKDGADVYVNAAWSGNVNKGTATVYITGKKDAKSQKPTSLKGTFKINAADISKAEVSVDDAAYAVNGAAPKVTVTYKFGEGENAKTVTLVNGVDYTLKYANNKKAGVKGNAVITGKGNYAGKNDPGKATFTINKLKLSDTEIKAVTACEKMKPAKVKAVLADKKTGGILKDSQYTLEIYTDKECTAKAGTDLKAGDAIYVKAKAKDTNNIEGETEAYAFTVGKDISKAKIDIADKYKKGIPYTGLAVKLDKQEYLKTNLKLKPETPVEGEKYDFEIVSYTNNVNKGTATAVIRGIGDYSGTKTIKFKIAAKKMVQEKPASAGK